VLCGVGMGGEFEPHNTAAVRLGSQVYALGERTVQARHSEQIVSQFTL
jgi:hypothetical protein